MSIFIKQFVTNKLKQITEDELLSHASDYDFALSTLEAKQIITYIRENNIDPFDQDNRVQLFTDLSRITNPETAKRAEQLLVEIIKSYGLEHLFD